MRVIEDAFTIIHIRISSIKILGISVRHFITGALIVFLIFNTYTLFLSVFGRQIIKFVEAAIIIVAIVYIALKWIAAWPKAGKLLNSVSEYENELNELAKKHHTK